MKLFDRLLAKIAPPCGHDTEIHQLRHRLEYETRLHDEKAAALKDAELHIQKLAIDSFNLQRAIVDHHPPDVAFVDSLQSLELQRRTYEQRIADLTLSFSTIDALNTELASSLEEANSRIAILQSKLREDDVDSQLDLIHAPADVDEPDPAAEDVVISDTTAEAAYRMVGLYFEGRHFWLLARADSTQIKAAIHDRDFLERMKRREVAFRSGDVLKAVFRVVEYRRPDGRFYATHTVERVIDVIAPEQQLDLTAAQQAQEALS